MDQRTVGESVPKLFQVRGRHLILCAGVAVLVLAAMLTPVLDTRLPLMVRVNYTILLLAYATMCLTGYGCLAMIYILRELGAVSDACKCRYWESVLGRCDSVRHRMTRPHFIATAVILLIAVTIGGYPLFEIAGIAIVVIPAAWFVVISAALIQVVRVVKQYRQSQQEAPQHEESPCQPGN